MSFRHLQEDLTGTADHAFLKMSAIGIALYIRSVYMNMEIRLSAGFRNAADQGCDLQRFILYPYSP